MKRVMAFVRAVQQPVGSSLGPTAPSSTDHTAATYRRRMGALSDEALVDVLREYFLREEIRLSEVRAALTGELATLDAARAGITFERTAIQTVLTLAMALDVSEATRTDAREQLAELAKAGRLWPNQFTDAEFVEAFGEVLRRRSGT